MTGVQCAAACSTLPLVNFIVYVQQPVSLPILQHTRDTLLQVEKLTPSLNIRPTYSLVSISDSAEPYYLATLDSSTRNITRMLPRLAYNASKALSDEDEAAFARVHVHTLVKTLHSVSAYFMSIANKRNHTHTIIHVCTYITLMYVLRVCEDASIVDTCMRGCVCRAFSLHRRQQHNARHVAVRFALSISRL